MDDALSQILTFLKPTSHITATLEAGGDWALRFAPASGVKFNAVLKGRCWLSVAGLPDSIRLEAGDCFLLNAGRSFVLSSDLAVRPIDAHAVFSVAPGGQAHCGEHCDVVAMGGRVMFEQAQAATLLLEALPPVIHVAARSEQAQTLRWTLQHVVTELTTRQPGAALMLDHLAHMMFVQVLRAYLAASGAQFSGWLAALMDRRIALALRLIHTDPGRHWSLESLATAASMSRSGFALRFKSLVGHAPLDYLLHWRMRLAAQALCLGERSVTAIGTSLGYTSESAFSHAFKRVTGASPTHYRRTSSEPHSHGLR